MKYLWIPLVAILVGCADRENQVRLATNLPNGAVTHVAFAEKANSLIAVNEFTFLSKDKEKCHTRLRRFRTSDWKMVVDSGELSLIHFTLAASDGPDWAAQAQEFYRLADGNPMGDAVMYKIDPGALRLTPTGANLGDFWPSAITQPSAKPLCAVHWKRYGERQPSPPAFVFDLEAGKTTIELEDFPTIGKREEYFTKTVLEFTPDGKQIVSCHPCKPYQIRLHAADTGKLSASMKLDSPATALKYSPNGKLLAALCFDGTVVILAPDLSKSVHNLRVEKQKEGGGYQSPLSMVFPDNESLAVISDSRKIELFGTNDWKPIRTLSVEKNQINCLASSPDGKLIVAGLGRQNMYPTKVHVYEVKTGKLVAELD